MLSENIVQGEHEVWFGRDDARPGWQDIDRNLRRIARTRAALDAEELRWLRAAIKDEIWRRLGMVSLHEYLEDRLGYSPRVAQERVRVAKALDELPELTHALAEGELPFTAIRELTRVATRHNEHEWLAEARGKNVRQIEELVAERERGDGPKDPKRPDTRRGDVTFREIRPETRAKLAEKRRALETELGMHLDDDQLLDALCGDTAGARQIVTVVCERCEQGWTQAGGKRFAIGAAALEVAECDAQRIDPETQRASHDIPPRVRRAVWTRDQSRCTAPGCRSTRHLDIHHIVPRSEGGMHDLENLRLLCSGHHRALHDGAPECDEAVLALITLGYKKSEARAAVNASRPHVGTGATVEAWIREALRRC
jgi:hypothetical protein